MAFPLLVRKTSSHRHFFISFLSLPPSQLSSKLSQRCSLPPSKQLAYLGQQNTLTTSLQRGKFHSMIALYMTQNTLLVRFSSARSLENAEYPFIATAPRSTLTKDSSTWKTLIYGSNRTVWHLNYVLMLNWIAGNITVFRFNCV